MYTPHKQVGAGGIWWSRRELQIILLIIDSKVNKEIAVLLGISESTVKWWIGKVIVKLGLDDGISGSSKRIQIARWALKHKLDEA